MYIRRKSQKGWWERSRVVVMRRKLIKIGLHVIYAEASIVQCLVFDFFSLLLWFQFLTLCYKNILNWHLLQVREFFPFRILWKSTSFRKLYSHYRIRYQKWSILRFLPKEQRSLLELKICHEVYRRSSYQHIFSQWYLVKPSLLNRSMSVLN